MGLTCCSGFLIVRLSCQVICHAVAMVRRVLQLALVLDVYATTSLCRAPHGHRVEETLQFWSSEETYTSVSQNWDVMVEDMPLCGQV